jgi:hypothetical protein
MKKMIMLSAFSVFLYQSSMAQGCSDAGVCTLHSIKDNTGSGDKDSKTKNNLVIGVGYGKGERSTDNYTGYIEYTRSLSSATAITGKLNYNSIRGELANTNGLGDIFLSVSHRFDAGKKWQKSVVAGIKLPLDNADKIMNGIRLPMPYQTSLGTTDLVLAINYNRKSFGATLAWQQPLRATNDNQFLPGNYPDEPLTLKYWPTKSFSRKADLVGRISYSIRTNNRFSIRPGLLGIYHLANDTYLDDNNNRKPIYNSTGLTLNANVFVGYKFKKGDGLELSLGTPFVVRDQRPDGLTRSFVASLEYQFRF